METFKFFILVFVVMSIFLSFLFLALYIKHKRKMNCQSLTGTKEEGYGCFSCGSDNSCSS